MTRTRIIFDHQRKIRMPAEEYFRDVEPFPATRGPQIMGDTEPYQSIVTKEIIGGRRQHREHLRAHNLEEVGNERLPERKPKEMPPAGPDVKEAIERVASGQKPEPLETHDAD